MTRYINVKVNISPQQAEKIKKAAEAGTQVNRLSHDDLNGEHTSTHAKSS